MQICLSSSRCISAYQGTTKHSIFSDWAANDAVMNSDFKWLCDTCICTDTVRVTKGDSCGVGMSEILKTGQLEHWCTGTFVRKELLTEQTNRTICERLLHQSTVASLIHLLFCSLYLIVVAHFVFGVPGRDPDRLLSTPPRARQGSWGKSSRPKEMKQSFLGFSARNELHCVSRYHRVRYLTESKSFLEHTLWKMRPTFWKLSDNFL